MFPKSAMFILFLVAFPVRNSRAHKKNNTPRHRFWATLMCFRYASTNFSALGNIAGAQRYWPSLATHHLRINNVACTA